MNILGAGHDSETIPVCESVLRTLLAILNFQIVSERAASSVRTVTRPKAQMFPCLGSCFQGIYWCPFPNKYLSVNLRVVRSV